MDYNPLRKRPGFAPYWRSKETLLLWNIPGAAFPLTPRKPTTTFLTLQARPTGGPSFYLTWLQARAWEPSWEKHQSGRKKKGQILPCEQVQEPLCTTMAHITKYSNQKMQGKRKQQQQKQKKKKERKKNQQLSPHLPDISGAQQFCKDWEGHSAEVPTKKHEHHFT